MSSSAPPPSSLSFSSSLSSSSENYRHLHYHRCIHYRIISPRFLFRCAITSASSVAAPKKKKIWRQGEYPGNVPENSSFDMKKRRTPIKNIKKKLDRKDNLNPWVKTVTEALSDSINTKQWLRALEVFEMLKEQPFYQPKEGTYMKLIVLLGRSGQPQHARKVFNTMIEEGLEPTAELYTALLAAYCRSNLIDEAFKILDQMKNLPFCQPDVYTFSILIKACVDASRFDLVESLYEQMGERSITPNTVTQNTVLAGYGKVGKFDQMEKVLLGMLDSSTSKPDVWTMNTILSLFGNMGHVETMEQWYEKFRNFGIDPETRTFNILIGAYGKKKMYDKMSTVMEYMRKLSFPWTTSTYNNVIEAFSDVGDAKNMEYTFDQMRAEGMRADTKTFCCLIRGYANGGLFHKVISVVQLAGKLEIPENTSFHNAVIYACAKADDLMEMERVFKRMKDQQCRPDATTFSMMEEAYKKEGMNDKVYDLEQEKQRMLNSNMIFV
ncbi:pentatricopeptide repeat-containing protein At3g06430, chloroplastic [Cynara cardunculus var. scolymus]|uniref:Pentatricopeptide repeat-containing protein n=1 Tax=Cynara cardunculus var. scolymus TaxID=59895 RepID=A0A103TWN9_CYNCS|nr:pentatricopeptide repeat-containing protein At3g06430, chloroplastic [Cynara cardunculus var. scolymus]KVH24770.1 Pentatricopeptide repeat-containing protein [Cynara cardunculus var. scolymus]